jgi:predicted nucleotidyltransferase component of viral defense system
MRDYLNNLIKNTIDSNKLNITREYLQSYLLLLLQKKDFFSLASFVGGTCLRFIYDLPRYSEDLDFSLHITKNEFKFIELITFLKKELQGAGYSLEISYKNNSNVYVAMIKFADLLYPLGISTDKHQKLNIKLDIDTNPPEGAINNVSLINKSIPLTLRHYNLSSIFSGKVNALMTRQFVKGRDYYDIFWILNVHPEVTPNFSMLRNALNQFNIHRDINEDNWKNILLEVVQNVDMKKVISDVSSFIENSLFLESFNELGFQLLLGKDNTKVKHLTTEAEKKEIDC